jgi:DeoR family glycerol-3-phosphate regulon repressor
MRPAERQREIGRAVAHEGGLSVEALAARFDVSPETIRRDLARLAREGAVQKVHGSARPPRLLAEGSRAERMGEGAEGKARIARALAALIEPGETLFMDAGTTTLACAEALAAAPDLAGTLTVVTNSLDVARALGGRAAVFLLGGALRADKGLTAGPLAIEQLGRFQADRAILTVAGLDAGAGATDAGFDEAQVARHDRAGGAGGGGGPRRQARPARGVPRLRRRRAGPPPLRRAAARGPRRPPRGPRGRRLRAQAPWPQFISSPPSMVKLCPVT